MKIINDIAHFLRPVAKIPYITLILKILITLGVIVFVGYITYIFITTSINDIKIRITDFNTKIIAEDTSTKFNWKRTSQNLKAIGATQMNPKLKKPFYYLIYHLIFGIIVSVGLWFINPWLCFLGIPLGWFILNSLYEYKNRQDNKQMIEDIFLLYNMLSIEISCGQHPQRALCHCVDSIQNKRLKRNLKEFKKHSYLNDKPFLENLTEFQANFKNDEIDSLCLILRQNEENGRSGDILRDIQKQIVDKQELQEQMKKENLNKRMTIVMIILFGDLAIYLILQIVMYMGNQMSQF